MCTASSLLHAANTHLLVLAHVLHLLVRIQALTLMVRSSDSHSSPGDEVANEGSEHPAMGPRLQPGYRPDATRQADDHHPSHLAIPRQCSSLGRGARSDDVVEESCEEEDNDGDVAAMLLGLRRA